MIFKKNKMMTLFLITLLVIVTGIAAFQFYQVKMEEKRQFHAFLNHFYVQVNHSIIKINALIDNDPEEETLDGYIRAVENALLKTDTILENGTYLMDYKIIYNPLFEVMTSLLYGQELPSIGLDRKISEEERSLLVQMEKYLQNIKNEMSSSVKTDSWSPDLTIEDFNQIISKYSLVPITNAYRKIIKMNGDSSNN